LESINWWLIAPIPSSVVNPSYHPWLTIKPILPFNNDDFLLVLTVVIFSTVMLTAAAAGENGNPDDPADNNMSGTIVTSSMNIFLACVTAAVTVASVAMAESDGSAAAETGVTRGVTTTMTTSGFNLTAEACESKECRHDCI